MLVVLSSGKLPEDTRTIREKGNYYVATLLPMVQGIVHAFNSKPYLMHMNLFT